MSRMLLCSTGTMVGRSNGYDFARAIYNIASFSGNHRVSGCELMMLPFFYGKCELIARELQKNGVKAITTHCEKEVGTGFSDAVSAIAEGNTSEGKAILENSFDLFRQNCEAAALFSSPRTVLHLWGGVHSDSHIGGNIGLLPQISEIAREYGIKVLIENIPCTANDPHSNWRRILESCPDCGLVFDTRFGNFHSQIEKTLSDSSVNGNIEHVHISDFRGGVPGEFRRLRPILHPGEGDVDFVLTARLLDAIGYGGTVTLESPVMGEDGSLDLPRLKASLAFLRALLNID